jgi:hypothetical protein
MADLFKLINYEFSFFLEDGGKHQWRCFGEQARWLDLRIDINIGSICCIYDVNDINRIYYIGVCDYHEKAKQPARLWVHPDHMPKLKAEARKRGIDYNIAWDKTRYKEVSPRTLLKAAQVLMQR